MRVKTAETSLVGLAVALMLSAATAAAQSADEVIRAAYEHHEKRMAGIDNYTVVQQVMGVEAVSYYEKQLVDGRSVYRLVETSGMENSEEDIGEFYYGFSKIEGRARRLGNERVEDRETHVLEVTDFSGLDFFDQQDGFKPKQAKFYIDTEDYIIRRIWIDGEVERNGSMQAATADISLEDYRTVEGMLHPFLMRMKVSGATAGLSEEELAEARKSLEEYRKQLAEMPESQRKMVENMMGEQIEQLEQLVESGDIEMSITVTELKVNEGPPN